MIDDKTEVLMKSIQPSNSDTPEKSQTDQVKIMASLFSSKLISTLFQDERLNFTPNKRLAYYLAKKDKIDFIYNTTALEGNPMTYPEVQTLLEGITVGGHKISDEQQVLNQNKALNLLFNMIERGEFEISRSVVCALNHKVSYEEALTWGVFRTGQLNIGGSEYKPPKADDLDQIFENGVKEITQIKNPIIRAVCYLLFGAINQFFWDGNKRTSRLVMNGVFISSGYPILNIKAKDRLEFNKVMLGFYDRMELSPALNYLIGYYIKQNNDFLMDP